MEDNAKNGASALESAARDGESASADPSSPTYLTKRAWNQTLAFFTIVGGLLAFYTLFIQSPKIESQAARIKTLEDQISKDREQVNEYILQEVRKSYDKIHENYIKALKARGGPLPTTGPPIRSDGGKPAPLPTDKKQP